MHLDQRMVREVFDAGASGYVLKSSFFDELIRAVEVVETGECYLSPKAASGLVNVLRGQDEVGSAATVEKLTPREQQVLRLVAEGKTTKQVAHHLRISPKTADAHRRQIMDKLGIFSIAELTKFAIREGLTSLDL
jgi:DNA-binding NarL/FixJ family response regulator